MSFSYDYLGRRVSKTQGDTTTKYCYDGDQVIAEYENDTLVRKFVYGPGIDEPIMIINVDGQNETKYYYHFDGLGSVVALSDTSGNIKETYEYDVFGKAAIKDSNDTLIDESLYDNPYFFTGRRLDSESGLYYYRARYYHPEIGRFLQTDPVGYAAGLNLYAYVGNNPLNWIDPLGLNKEEEMDDIKNIDEEYVRRMKEYMKTKAPYTDCDIYSAETLKWGLDSKYHNVKEILRTGFFGHSYIGVYNRKTGQLVRIYDPWRIAGPWPFHNRNMPSWRWIYYPGWTPDWPWSDGIYYRRK